MSKSLLEQVARHAFAQVDSYLRAKVKSRANIALPRNFRQADEWSWETLAFYFSKGKTHRDIYQQISSWLRSQYGDRFEDREVLEEIVNMTSSDYRMMAVEVVALTNWMRRFADGLVK